MSSNTKRKTLRIPKLAEDQWYTEDLKHIRRYVYQMLIAYAFFAIGATITNYYTNQVLKNSFEDFKKEQERRDKELTDRVKRIEDILIKK
jgi:hypothetical protein